MLLQAEQIDGDVRSEVRTNLSELRREVRTDFTKFFIDLLIYWVGSIKNRYGTKKKGGAGRNK